MKKMIGVLAVMLAAGGASAAMLNAGTSEFGVGGTLNFESAAGARLDLNTSYGYFFIDNLMVAGRFGVFNDNSYQGWDLGAKCEYNFDLGPDYEAIIGTDFVPYIGGALDFKQSNFKDLDEVEGEDSKRNAVVFGIEGGVKFFLTESVAVSAALVYEAATAEIYARKDNEYGKTEGRLELGMRFYF